VPIAAAAIALRWLGIKYVTVVYVESICRVESLSLSGKLLLPFTDHFLVQWPNLVSKYPKARFIGRLC
jgi:beta-1,4-N-acetylglucosaminyltransferase